MHVHTHTHTHTHAHMYTHTHAYTHACACTHACMHTHTLTHTHTHTCIHACMCMYTCMHASTHRHTHTLFSLFQWPPPPPPTPTNHQWKQQPVEKKKVHVQHPAPVNELVQLRVGRYKEIGFKRSFELWERTALLDVRRKVVPDKGRLSREWLVTKALKFQPCSRTLFFFFHLNWNGRYVTQIWRKVPAELVCPQTVHYRTHVYTSVCRWRCEEGSQATSAQEEELRLRVGEKKGLKHREEETSTSQKVWPLLWDGDRESECKFCSYLSVLPQNCVKKEKKRKVVLNRKKPQQQVLEQDMYM